MTMRTDRIRPTQVLFPLGLGTALSLMGDATLYTVLPTHTADAGITLAGVGILLGANRAVRLILNGPAGLAYDRWPARRLYVPALFIGALSTVVYAATRGFWPLLAGRLLWGLAWSGIWVGGATMILGVAGAGERGRWAGLYQTWFFLGGAVGALSGGVITDWLGYGAAMWVGAAVTALGGLVALLMLPETRPLSMGDGPGALPLIPRIRAVRASRLRVRGPLLLAVSLQGLSRFAISGVLSATLSLLVADHIESGNLALGTATLTGILMAGRTLLSMFSAPLAGTLSDRLDDRWRVMGVALTVGVVGMILLSTNLPIVILAGVLVVAVARGGIQSLTTSLTGDLVSEAQRGRAVGALHTASDLGSAIGPSVAYALLPWVGLRGAYWLCAALFAVGLFLTVWMRHKRVTPG
jgi:MFS family permease